MFLSAMIGNDQLVFVGLLPSPLGRVAERSEVGRGFQRFLLFSAKRHPKNLFRQPFGLPPSPKGKARRCAQQRGKQQFIEAGVKAYRRSRVW